MLLRNDVIAWQYCCAFNCTNISDVGIALIRRRLDFDRCLIDVMLGVVLSCQKCQQIYGCAWQVWSLTLWNPLFFFHSEKDMRTPWGSSTFLKWYDICSDISCCCLLDIWQVRMMTIAVNVVREWFRWYFMSLECNTDYRMQYPWNMISVIECLYHSRLDVIICIKQIYLTCHITTKYTKVMRLFVQFNLCLLQACTLPRVFIKNGNTSVTQYVSMQIASRVFITRNIEVIHSSLT